MPASTTAIPSFKIGGTLATLILGFLGGVLFYFLHFPMPWLIGAMVTLAAVAIYGRVELSMPKKLRNGMMALLGLMVGSTLNPDTAANMHTWWLSIMALPVLLVLQFIFAQILLKYLAPHENFATRFFGGAAGGLIEMVTLAQEKGGDERSVLVMHMLRLSMLVFFAPLVFSVTLNGHSMKDMSTIMNDLFSYGWANTGLMFICLFGGIYGGRLLRLPASAILGPFLLAAVFYGADLLQAQPPYAVMVLAQIGVGADLGTRFLGYGFKRIQKLLLPTTLLTAALAAIAAFVAYGTHLATNIPFATLFLAFMPGGMTQMSLIALALNLNAGFVMTHLIVRVLFVVLLAPFCYKYMAKFFDQPYTQRK